MSAEGVHSQEQSLTPDECNNAAITVPGSAVCVTELWRCHQEVYPKGNTPRTSSTPTPCPVQTRRTASTHLALRCSLPYSQLKPD